MFGFQTTVAFNRSARYLSQIKSNNFLKQTSENCFRYQSDLPRLPIPSVDNSVNRYLKSLQAQLGSGISENDIEEANILAKTERNELEELHRILTIHDSNHQNTSFLNGPWTEMYLKDRTPFPFNNTPYLGLSRDPNEQMNDPLLRACNILISTVRFHNSLNHKILNPEFLRGKPADMSQYRFLTASTRIPDRKSDYLKKYEDSNHVLVICRGMFYKLDVKENGENIMPTESIYNALHCIKNHAYSSPRNDCSIAYLSSTNRDVFAEIRPRLTTLSEQNARNLEIIDSAIFALILDDEVNEPVGMYKRGLKKGNCNYLGGNGDSRWWDKSFSWIISDGGDAFITFEHSWGDGMAIRRLMKEVYTDSTENPSVSNPEHGTPSSFNELNFDLNDQIKSEIYKARSRYDNDQNSLSLSTLTIDKGKSFFKSKKLSPDGILQLSFQAAYLRCITKFCPVYESVTMSGFLHGRTETLRSCTLESTQAARLIVENKSTRNELKSVIKNSGNKHRQLAIEASSGQGFDRHFWGMKHHARLNKLQLPKLLSNQTQKHMLNYNLSTSTLDMEFAGSFGFAPVVNRGFGIGYFCHENQCMFDVSARKDVDFPTATEFSQAIEKSLNDIIAILDG